MPIVGSYARVRAAEHAAVRERLSALPGVSCFELGEPERIGVLIEVDSLEVARQLLEQEIPRVEGLLGVFPITVDYQDELAPEEGRVDERGDRHAQHET